MIEIDTLGRNKTIFNPNKELMDQGSGIWDLTRSSVSFSRINLKISKFYTVTEEAQMRPDLICLQAYGNLTNIGSLMKINSYSNPFAISEGMLFAVPIQDRLDAAFDQKRKAIAQNNTSANPNSAFRRPQENKAFKVSDSRKKFVEAQTQAKNPIPQALPPNVLQEGEVQVLKTPQVIALGPSVSAAGPNPNGLPL
jgi:hypothetical protein